MTEKPSESHLPWLIVLIIVGIPAGLVAGVVIWYIFVGIQYLLHIPSAHLYAGGPLSLYLVAWAIAGAFGLPFFFAKRK